jgi:hypothetical protein
MQSVARGIPPASADEVVPFGDEVAQRTTGGSRVAERDSAVHTPAGLLGHLAGALLRILSFVNLAPVPDPLVYRPLGSLDTMYLQESARISHGSPP